MNLSRADFVERFGGIYEHSPWVAEGAWTEQLAADRVSKLAARMAKIVDTAEPEQQLKLIQAHPDLAGRLAVAGELTAESSAEQASAGLDQCTEAEFAAFQQLNAAYLDKFQFPFVMAVRGSNRAAILDAFRRRLENSYDAEFQTALQEIHKIARLRLEQLGLEQ